VGCGDDVITVEIGVGVGNAVVAWPWVLWLRSIRHTRLQNRTRAADCRKRQDQSDEHECGAAPIVILASSVCVPRGPKAVLETELLNNAPASLCPAVTE
jgi:hypothetical protein